MTSKGKTYGWMLLALVAWGIIFGIYEVVERTFLINSSPSTLHILHIPSTRMNYRDYKNFHIDGFFHVYNRGHNKDLIFRDDDDYRFFLSRARQLLGLQKTKGSRWICPLPPDTFSILCYCLMPNHFHLLINQKTNVSVSSFIGRTALIFSMISLIWLSTEAFFIFVSNIFDILRLDQSPYESPL